MQQAGSSIADIQDDVASLLKGRAGKDEYTQHIKIDNVMSEIDAEDLASKIQKKCSAAKGSDEEVVHVKEYMPLPVASDLEDPSMRDALSMRKSGFASIWKYNSKADHFTQALTSPTSAVW